MRVETKMFFDCKDREENVEKKGREIRSKITYIKEDITKARYFLSEIRRRQ